MAAPGIDFRFSNRADWTAEFSLRRYDPSVSLPWAGQPAWGPGQGYGLGSAVVTDDGLFLADPTVVTGPWTSAATFAADVDASGRSRWQMFGSAQKYRTRPRDLTGVSLSFAVMTCAPDGTILDPRPKLPTGSADGGLLLTNPGLGGVAIAIPKVRVRSVPEGLYRYDISGLYAGGAVKRLRYGFLLVDQGITP